MSMDIIKLATDKSIRIDDKVRMLTKRNSIGYSLERKTHKLMLKYTAESSISNTIDMDEKYLSLGTLEAIRILILNDIKTQQDNLTKELLLDIGEGDK